MPKAHVHALLDAGKGEAELMAECPVCGAVAIEAFTLVWSNRFISCECGLTLEVVLQDLRQLRTMAVEFQRAIDKVVGSN